MWFWLGIWLVVLGIWFLIGVMKHPPRKTMSGHLWAWELIESLLKKPKVQPQFQITDVTQEQFLSGIKAIAQTIKSSSPSDVILIDDKGNKWRVVGTGSWPTDPTKPNVFFLTCRHTYTDGSHYNWNGQCNEDLTNFTSNWSRAGTLLQTVKEVLESWERLNANHLSC